ncbi:MAG: DNA translocase FtsK, partial [Candidatus Nealsonbacteria bacterium]|nr:DNA translocase FtsK [Candidatus Nealsonbacteria bacterium]
MSRKSRRKFREGKPLLPPEVKQGIWAVLLMLLAVLIGLSFFNKAGQAGDIFIRNSHFLIGEAIFITPLVLILAGLVFFKAIKNAGGRKEVFDPTILAILIMILGIAGFLGLFDMEKRQGGVVGYFITWPFLRYFGFWASFFIFMAPIAIGIFIFWHFLRAYESAEIDEKEKKTVLVPEAKGEEKPSIIRKIFAPRFKTEDLFPSNEEKQDKPAVAGKTEAKPASSGLKFPYNPPPIDLLEREHGSPTSGDIKVNSAIIKRTLQNFGIDVSMSEINIGPTVTQYTLKPAEGVKLSKITTLNNDLSLALASHPIRIEAPVPGRALVGIEIPNKVRAQVRLRSLIETPEFQKSTSDLLIPLGKDVSGVPIYIDLARMPHMLVAGSTGTGKTIFLNSLIMSLLYQSSGPNKSASPTHLRLIMVDPKRVEFPVYSQLPHLLCPVIYNATQTINALRWLTGEME